MTDRLVSTVAEVLEISPDLVKDAMSMDNCPQWDSLRHFALILALEDVFGVHFSSDEIPELTQVGLLRAKLTELSGQGDGAD